VARYDISSKELYRRCAGANTRDTPMKEFNQNTIRRRAELGCSESKKYAAMLPKIKSGK